MWLAVLIQLVPFGIIQLPLSRVLIIVLVYIRLFFKCLFRFGLATGACFSGNLGLAEIPLTDKRFFTSDGFFRGACNR